MAVHVLLGSDEHAAADRRCTGVSARLGLPAAAAGEPRVRWRRDDLPGHPGAVAGKLRALESERSRVGRHGRARRHARVHRGHRSLEANDRGFSPTPAENFAPRHPPSRDGPKIYKIAPFYSGIAWHERCDNSTVRPTAITRNAEATRTLVN